MTIHVKKVQFECDLDLEIVEIIKDKVRVRVVQNGKPRDIHTLYVGDRLDIDDVNFTIDMDSVT